MKRFVTILLLTAALAVTTTTARADDDSLYFFSPEFGPGNLSVLTEAVDAFLDDADVDLRFQAFARLEDLRRESSRNTPAFVIAPDWVLRHECIAPSATPIAQPLSAGAASGRRALMAGPQVAKLADISDGSVAAALQGTTGKTSDASMNVLQNDYPGINIIPVPKDIDALLAVGFGQVDAAFVSLAQFRMLERVNPNLTANLHEIGYSQDSPFPRVYATDRASQETINTVSKAFSTVVDDEAGRRMFAMLGFDGVSMLVDAGVEPIRPDGRCDFDERGQR